MVQRYFPTGTQTKDFTSLTKRDKNSYIRYYSQWQENNNTGGKLYRVSGKKKNWTALHSVLNAQTILLYEKELDHVLVPKFYHDKRSTDWLGKLKLVREIPPEQNYRHCQVKTIGRKIYLYKSGSSTNMAVLHHHHLLDWSFPDKYFPAKRTFCPRI